MLKQFFAIFDNDDFDSWNIKHIQYNVLKRLQEVKYLSYKRIDVLIIDTEQDDKLIERDDKIRVVIKCFVNPVYSQSNGTRESVAAIYQSLFKSLEALWEKKQWDVLDLQHIYADIEESGFTSSMKYGKPITSPDKKHKVELYCELFPGSCDYTLIFLDKKGNILRKTLFLHGHPDPDMFFGFFSNNFWKDDEYFFINDKNKEIFYIFNLKEPGFSLEFRPISNTLEECQNYNAAFQAGLSNNERLKLLGIPA